MERKVRKERKDLREKKESYDWREMEMRGI